MNKKKFLATCTLVAFGSTMLPAFAFAAPLEATKIAADAEVNANKTTYIAVDTTAAWFAADDQAQIVNLRTDKVLATAEKDDITDFDGSNGTAEFVLNGGLPVGAYQVVFANTSTKVAADDSNIGSNVTAGTAGATEKITFEVVDSILANDTKGSVVSTLTINTKGEVVKTTDSTKVTDGTGLNTITVAGTNSANIYALDGRNGLIPADAKEVATATNGVIDATKMTVGTYYGSATSLNDDKTIPDVVFCYTSDLKGDVDKVVAAEKSNLQAIADLIPDNIVLNTKAGATTTGLVADMADLPEIDAEKDLKAAIGANKVGVISVSGIKSSYVTYKENAFDAAADKVSLTDSTTTFDADAQFNTYKLPTATAEVTFAVALDGIPGMYAKKTSTVTINTVTTLAEAVDAYGAANFSNYDKATNKGSIEFTSKDQGFDLTTKVAGEATKVKEGHYAIKSTSGISSYELANYFDIATGKVTALPEKDITFTVTLGLNTAAAGAAPSYETGGDITVTTTIKAAGDADKELAEAEKVATEKATAFATVAGTAMNDGKVSDAEWEQMMAAYLEFMTAYNAYVEAGGQA